MPVQPGEHLLHYRAIEQIGAGAMGVVWKAVDTTLEREVAIKILPDDFARDAERLARFERDAKLLASINHPHIASVFGLHESDGVHFLAMELVAGEDLEQRIARGRVPITDALKIAVQVAEALEAAHESGVIHRDLKPANVLLGSDGAVKVLDFGLAKSLVETSAQDPTAQTLSVVRTQEGRILGTPAYMAPEQARGEPVDRRADIWAFGCLLFEMLTGKRPFEATTQVDTLVAVLAREPDWERLPAATPRAVRRLVRRCLAKDLRQRLHDIGDARLELEEVGGEAAHDLRPGQAGRRKLVVTGMCGIVLGALLAVAFLSSGAEQSGSHPTSPRGAVMRREITLPESAPLAFGAAPVGFDSALLALSPDGSQLVYVGGSKEETQLYLQELASFDDPRPIPGTKGALCAFFSPEGQWLGFLTHDKLKKVSLSGDTPQPICSVRTATKAWWTRDDVIWFADAFGSRLRRVPATGGEVEEIRIGRFWSVDDLAADGRSALVRRRARGMRGDYAVIHLLDLETLEHRPLVEDGYDPRYVASGYVLFARAGNLLAAPFDLNGLSVTGEAVPVVRDVGMDSLFCHAQVAVSPSGVLAYLPGGERARGRIAWVDRQGNEGLLPLEPGIYGVFDLAPDDTHLAVHVGDIDDYIWIYDIEHERGRKLSGKVSGGWPVWNPAGDTIAFGTGVYGTGEWKLMTQTVAGGDDPRELLAVNPKSLPAYPASWSPNGRVLAYNNGDLGLGFVTVTEEPTPDWSKPAGVSQFHLTFSPDGRWVTYGSDETGRFEIWVRSFPDGEVSRQISAQGGIEPLWCWKTNEIIFRKGGTWYASKVTLEPEFDFETPRVVFKTDFIDTPGISFDVSSDGQRLYVVKKAEAEERHRIHVIANWFDELERLVPGDK